MGSCRLAACFQGRVDSLQEALAFGRGKPMGQERGHFPKLLPPRPKAGTARQVSNFAAVGSR
jgi:hypothetical protein